MLIPKCCKNCSNRHHGICCCSLPYLCNEYVEDEVIDQVKNWRNKKMSSEEIKKEMIKIGMSSQNCDPEIWHSEADKLLIKVLRDLGYNELCDWWENGEKWYA